MHFFHSEDSKVKNGSTSPLVTGGSWKKSPVITNCEADTFSLNHQFEENRDTPVCRQMDVRRYAVDSGRLMRGYRTSVRQPWKLGPVYSYIVRWDLELKCSLSSMINTSVVFHRLSAGLHDRMRLICLSKSSWPGVTAPQEWIVIPVKHNATKSGGRYVKP